MSKEELAAEAEARVGRVLRDKWRLEALVGIGGMASVYRATHRNRSRAAVKVLHRSLSGHEAIRKRFLREGYVANTVDHPGAVRVLDDDVDEEGAAFLVLELLEGQTLEELWELGRALPLGELLGYVDQLLDVLGAAHDKGIVHRDVKPDNVFVTTSGTVKLLDFGIARLDEAQGSVTATSSGVAMGTPAYMAPEQARARWELVDARTDVWAVGALLFTLLTGRFVHEAETSNEMLIAAATLPAPPLRSLVPEAPEPVAGFVDRCLAYERAARYPTAREARAALREAVARSEGLELRFGGATSVPATAATISASDLPLVAPGEAAAPLRSDPHAATVPLAPTPSAPATASSPAVTAASFGVPAASTLSEAATSSSSPGVVTTRRSWPLLGAVALLPVVAGVVLWLRGSDSQAPGAPLPTPVSSPPLPLTMEPAPAASVAGAPASGAPVEPASGASPSPALSTAPVSPPATAPPPVTSSGPARVGRDRGSRANRPAAPNTKSPGTSPAPDPFERQY